MGILTPPNWPADGAPEPQAEPTENPISRGIIATAIDRQSLAFADLLGKKLRANQPLSPAELAQANSLGLILSGRGVYLPPPAPASATPPIK